ncbi:MAG: cyclic nucleotide-binding domain-containing protein [Pseudomonadota bacterium]
MTSVIELCSDLAEAQFAPGETLIAEGDPSPGFFVLVSGTVLVRKGDAEIARISEPGAVFGEISALLGSRASASVVAKSAIHALATADGAVYLQENSALALHTARLLAERVVQATAYVSDLKAQFPDRADHFGAVEDVLDALMTDPRARDRRTTGPR